MQCGELTFSDHLPAAGGSGGVTGFLKAESLGMQLASLPHRSERNTSLSHPVRTQQEAEEQEQQAKHSDIRQQSRTLGR